jgi:TolB-like protein/Tfp pilus assembly protein PilF
MATARGSEKLELELLPKELYGNVPRSRSRQGEDDLNPATQGGIFEQLYHRNVFHMALLYALLCWVVVEVAPPLFRELHLPSFITTIGAVVAVLGFPVFMLFAWSRQLTATGWKPVGEISGSESLAAPVRKRLNRAIVFVAAVGVGYLVVGKFFFTARDAAPEAPAVAAAAPAAAVAPAGASAGGTAALPSASIAVLSFTDASEAKDLAYKANGLSEGLPSALAGVAQLTVTSADSSLRFRSGAADAASIGTILGVRYLLEGSVRQVNERMQASVRLIDTRDGTQRLSDTFERDLADAFQLRDDIAAGVAKALAIPMDAGGTHSRRGVRNLDAYDLYLRGRQAFRREDRAGYQQAADLYGQARDIEPQSPAIETDIAEVNLAMVERGYLDAQTGVERARGAAEHAVALDPGLAKARLMLAVIHSRYDWDWPAARHELDQANSLEPNDAFVLAERGVVSLAAGQYDSAARVLQSAAALDPLNGGILLELARAQLWGGQSAPAEATLQRLIQLDPNQRAAHYTLGTALLAAGDQEGALAQMKLEVDARHRLAGLATVFYAMGRKAESDAAMVQLKPLAASQWASGLAGAYASRNEPDAALQWLDRAYAQKDADLRVVRGDPSFRGLAGDPRFGEFLRKISLPG